ncbi:MAG: pyridoxal phosphate-dependent aminotransferase [Acidobacteriaceae bacterium]
MGRPLKTKISALRLAKRLDEVRFSDIVQVRNKVMAMRAAGEVVHGFHGGEPFFATPVPVKYAMMQALVEDKTRYAPSSGMEQLRTAIAQKLRTFNHRTDVSIDKALLTVGGSHALYAAFQCVLDPGDDVLVFSPYWPPIRDLITGAQGRPLLVPTVSARIHGIAAALERYSTPQTRAIYYNTPQNPNGVVFTPQEAEEVAAFARKHDLIVIADEAYEDIVYEGEHFSIATLPGMAERTITTYTLSKSFSMTGLRVGYVVADEPWMTGMRKIVLYSTNGVSTPTQWGALEAMRMPRELLATRRDEYRQRRDLLVQALNDVGLECTPPAGAFYVFPKATKIHKNSRKAAEVLLDGAHVATIPGVAFGAQGEGHLRFSYSISMEMIEAGIAALKKFLG